MGLIYDQAGLAAVMLTRIAAEESQGPGELSARIHAVILDLLERSGQEGIVDLATALARQHFFALDLLGRATGEPVESLLDAVELEELERIADEAQRPSISAHYAALGVSADGR